MDQRASNKCGSFENDIHVKLGPTVIKLLGLLLRLPLADLK